jgi:hypothetical protein
MNARERFHRILDFNIDIDRLPMIEWAAWWDVTMNRWKSEGLPEMDFIQSQKYFGLDPMAVLWAGPYTSGLPQPEYHGGPIVGDAGQYDDIRGFLFTDSLIESVKKQAEELRPAHERGEIIVRVWLDGFFWFPRTMFGIEPHFYAFYDNPELMHRINTDLADYNIRVFDAICAIIKPDMVGFAEDMSYNHGPMLSKALFNEFLLPYYRRVAPHIKQHDVKIFADSDGDVTAMIPWLIEAGIGGVYPLERQAGVDLNRIRKEYPGFLMMGGYDKMVMSKGEKEMRAEFERLLPVMKLGGYIPSVDHQTPPGVSLENYKVYIELFKEYAARATTK